MKCVYLDEKDWINVSRANEGSEGVTVSDTERCQADFVSSS